jgi:hypothetical protein
MKALTALALSAVAFASQEKTYDLKLETKPVQGQRSEQAETDSMKMVMKVNGRTAVAQENAKEFAASEEILSVDSDLGTKRRWTFSKAARTSEGKTVPYAFQGKIVIVTQAKGKELAFALDGGAELSKEDVAGLKSFAGKKEEGKPGGAELFAPDRPVKTGETWTKDLKKLVEAILDKEMAKAVDLANSKLSFTLKSVESRGGVEYGKITGVMEFSFTAFGPLKLEQPIPMTFTVDLDCCIDGKLPDGQLKMKGEMKGKSAADTEQGKIELEIEMTMEGNKTVKSSK